MNLKDYIYVVSNALSNKLCDELINEYEKSEDWVQTEIASGLDKSIRNCQAIGISWPVIMEKNLNVRKDLDGKIYEGASKCIEAYKKLFPRCQVIKDDGYSLLRYNEGAFYKQHTDHYHDQNRSVSCSFALNDDFEGGEFAFFDRELKYKLGKGDAIMFPSNFMYPHEVMPVTKGTRYSIITWFI
jgi:predicted 2-oxoglutarate/Fe(II)-dependent dioxygenase YbiX